MATSEALRAQERIAYIHVAIAEITKQLKGPLNNVERAWLVVDRKDFRDELAKLVPHDKPGTAVGREE